jgi:hypothetical protein
LIPVCNHDEITFGCLWCRRWEYRDREAPPPEPKPAKTAKPCNCGKVDPSKLPKITGKI